MRQVGRRAAPEDFGSAERGVRETSRVTETAVALAGGRCPLPKGLYRFKTHEHANRWQEQHLAAFMRELAEQRKHG